MLDKDTIKELLARTEITGRNKLLICLAHEPLRPQKVAEVREIAVNLGLRAAKSWDVSKHLSNAKTLAIRTADGWELTASGKSLVAEIAGPLLPSVSTPVISGLRKHLPSISNDATRGFVEEAIKAFESRLLRSAVVLSWVGAVSVLYDHIVKHRLVEFNAEALRRDLKWKEAKTPDDLARMKENDFLQILSAMSVIGKNVKDELEGCLKTRNGCGHPNSLQIGEHKVASHVETLIQNIFAKF
ncbi:hypothetical protein [Burkholderia vietnamiensis]|uniref:hypothetical protein n=1 Tax=Burkholderia vietnamiensis TaxID=60552 RepID=UPI001B900D9B|nr:hypothetical protein [Burkholderia vietnamiensis]MBR8284601.1 hypothetical protein [Burkholderia vietnamiensis]